jgi:CHAT domain-containing protein/tetratricopeptide (TPR) repeat protein
MSILEKVYGTKHSEVARVLGNLAALRARQGRFAEVAVLQKRTLAILEELLGPDHPQVALTLRNMAQARLSPGRAAEAERLIERARAIYERAFGPEHADVIDCVELLSMVERDRKRYDAAQLLLAKALAGYEKALGADNPEVARCLVNVAENLLELKRYDDAEAALRRALTIDEKRLGPDDPALVHVCSTYAELERQRQRPAEAEGWIERAIAVADRAGTAPGSRAELYDTRAALAWEAGRKGEALADLRQAIELAEGQRGQLGGTEQERAEFAAKQARTFERMIAWQVDLGDPGEALTAIERARARLLLESLAASGADLDAGRPAAERQRLRDEESTLKAEVARLEKQVALVEADAGRKDEAARLRNDLTEARRKLFDHDRETQNSNPVFRNLLARGAGTLRLSQVQRRLCADGGLLLSYYCGQEGGYVVAVGPDRARLYALRLDDDDARVLGADAGPLTADRLRKVLMGTKGAGILDRLAAPAGEGLGPRLAALWRTLIPADLRQSLTDGTVRRLIVLPDGPLALLPFETLVTAGSETSSPRYLLDRGPPILYGPSATVLMTLGERRGAGPAGRDPVLALGDPAYPQDAPEGARAHGASAARARFSLAGGRLSRLPYSGVEAQWVAKAFNDQGIKAGILSGPTATEAGVRHWAPGRRLLHLACHGLTDQDFGNYYGALVLAPGPRGDADPDDDGVLSLGEICGLDLKGCELAILSACQTNFGPEQQGEGTLALTRGFLVAGTRRVVASDWLVDDEAAASLVSVYCGLLAKAEAAGKAADYAGMLQEAKRWVRKQSRWQHPYYWASLVLVGPP